MDFVSFLSRISQIKEQPLGGESSQFKMAPRLRLKYSKTQIEANKPRDSAVLVLFYPDSDYNTHILLTLRSAYKGIHGSQISFPGGKMDKKDGILKETALREAQEEVGISKNDVRLIRPISKTYIPPSNFWVQPYLGYVEKTPVFVTNYEVEKIIPLPLEKLLNKELITTQLVTTSYLKQKQVPCYKINEHVIWGATAMILSEVVDLILLN